MPLALLIVLLAGPPAPRPAPALDAATAQRFADLALSCVGREYPNKIAHTLESDGDAKPPRLLTPAFFGCYDWHSSVHGHWLLARLARRFPEAPFAGAARAALRASFTPEKVAGEVAYLSGKGRATFERPYGLAWLLRLGAELRGWDDSEAREWAKTLEPLERAAASRLAEWLPKLAYPIREGEHAQTAFAFGLVLDWARVAGDASMERLVTAKSRDLYANDRACPLAYEPSGQDFLSPCLAEADLMRRILAPPAFGAWLRRFLPGIPPDGSAWLPVAVVTDPSDGKLAHLDGLNLSRAWMLEGIAASLPRADPRLRALRLARARHRESGLAAVTGAHYEGGHWLGTFAVYLVTGAGLPGFERRAMNAFQIGILFGSAVAAGIMNALAGGGTILTFPALLLAGVPAIQANATSTVALVPGAISSLAGYRREVGTHRRWLTRLLLPSLLGGALGSVLLLLTPEKTFARLAPFLVLFATLLFLFQIVWSRRAPETGGERTSWGLASIAQFLVAIYGGYFGAGVGILMLVILGFLGLTDIHAMNGLKNFFGICINGVASAWFIFKGVVNWPLALLMMAGAIAGGWIGAGFARRIGKEKARIAVVVIGFGITIVLFLQRS